MHVQTLPYIAPANPRRSVFKRFSVVIPLDGVEVKTGRATDNLTTAMRRAREASLKYGYATITDGTRPTGRRMVGMFKRGKELLDPTQITKS